MYLVLNEDKSEGYASKSLRDAKHAAGIQRVRQLSSAIADKFQDYYAEAPLNVVEIDPEENKRLREALESALSTMRRFQDETSIQNNPRLVLTLLNECRDINNALKGERD